MIYSRNQNPHTKVSWGNYLKSDLNEAALLSSRSLISLSNAEILITGGTGFVGSWVAAVLIHARTRFNLDFGITLSIRDPNKLLKFMNLGAIPNINLIIGDLQETCEQIELKNLAFSHVIHAATPTTVDFPKALCDEILEGTSSLIHSVSRKIPPRFIHLSSGAVYGLESRQNKFLTESEILADSSSWQYAQCKIGIEEMVRQKTMEGALYGGNPRLFTFMGPHLLMDNTFAIGEFVRKSLNKEKISVVGNRKSTRSYMYPTDLVSWILAILVTPTLKPTHIGSESAWEMWELAEVVNKIFEGVGIEQAFSPTSENHYVPKTLSTKDRYLVEETVDLTIGLERWRNWINLN